MPLYNLGRFRKIFHIFLAYIEIFPYICYMEKAIKIVEARIVELKDTLESLKNV